MHDPKQLHVDLSVHQPIPPEVEGEPLSEEEWEQAKLDYEEKRYFRLVLTLNGGVLALHSPMFPHADLAKARASLSELLDTAKEFVVLRVSDLL